MTREAQSKTLLKRAYVLGYGSESCQKDRLFYSACYYPCCKEKIISVDEDMTQKKRAFYAFVNTFKFFVLFSASFFFLSLERIEVASFSFTEVKECVCGIAALTCHTNACVSGCFYCYLRRPDQGTKCVLLRCSIFHTS